MPKQPLFSEDIDAMVERVAPAILELLADGVPRSKTMIGRALADRHFKDEVKRALMRLAVTGRVAEKNGKYALAPAGVAGSAWVSRPEDACRPAGGRRVPGPRG